MEQSKTKRKSSTSWEPIGKWYQNLVGDEGHYYHQHVILPGILKLLNITKTSKSSLLDLACGSGVLARQLPKEMTYYGIDISPSLIHAASKEDLNSLHHFSVGDVTKPLGLKKTNFQFVTIVLAAQNMEHPEQAFKNAFAHLESEGKLLIIINHPCFRIPRQSSWQIDQQNKVQFRRVDRYLSTLKIPIQAHPSKKEKSAETWSFHHSLSTYSSWLKDSGFMIETLEEWCSDKQSTGKNAKMENRSRSEFPLFLAILAIKKE